MEAAAVDCAAGLSQRPARPAGRSVALRLSALIALASVVAGGCATSSAMRKGRDAEQVNDYDRAVVQYTQAVKQKPDSADARLALQRVKLRASDLKISRI